jgi:hypothetical protein
LRQAQKKSLTKIESAEPTFAIFFASYVFARQSATKRNSKEIKLRQQRDVTGTIEDTRRLPDLACRDKKGSSGM